MAGRTYGYARVSTREQNRDRQLDALSAFGVDGVFADKASGRGFERPEWMRLTAALRAGDVLVVKSIDRLGRGYEEIIGRWRAITKEIRADIVLQQLSYVAQVERECIHRHQAEGIAAARACGVRFGRPRKRRPGLYKNTRESYLAGHISRSMAGCCIKVFVSSIEKVAIRGPGDAAAREVEGRESAGS